MKIFLKLILSSFLFYTCTNSIKQNESKATIVFKEYRKLSEKELRYYKYRAQKVYDSIFVKYSFNGSILIQKNGEIILEKYNGYSNFNTKKPIKPKTPFHIASISKTFTAAVILRLIDQGKLKFTDSIQQFFPAFPFHEITIHSLLSHRSGLANYAYFMGYGTLWNQYKKASNQDMLQFIIETKPDKYNKANKSFSYCNTNYALLALIIEKVTGNNYPQYLQDSIFKPLGMNNSFVFSIRDSSNYNPSFAYNNRSYPLESIDFIYGDKNIYSTVRDLMIWDHSIYSNNIYSKEMYELAITPYSNERKSIHNYGYGFRLMIYPNEKIVYHNGWWHGNNTVFTRLVKDSAAIFLLGNKYNRAIYSGFKLKNIFSTTYSDIPIE